MAAQLRWIPAGPMPVGYALTGLSGPEPYIWYDEHNSEWVSNTPPVFGIWKTADDGKAAIVAELRSQAEERLRLLTEFLRTP